MLKQTAYFLGFLIALTVLFVIGERAFSPTFQGCVSTEQQAENANATKEQPPGFRRLVVLYVDCSGGFINRHGAGITAIATIVIAAFTGTLWVATSRQAFLTREALVADKRAFVAAVNIYSNWELDASTGHYNWRFRPIWQNSGDTPTKRLRIYSQCELRNSLLPSGFDFNQTTTTPGEGLLAPKITLSGGVAPQPPAAAITAQDIFDAQNGKKFIYLWGWARYFDVFADTPEHITRFCWVIMTIGDPFTFDPKNVSNPLGTPGTLSISYIQSKEGNCADEGCA